MVLSVRHPKRLICKKHNYFVKIHDVNFFGVHRLSFAASRPCLWRKLFFLWRIFFWVVETYGENNLPMAVMSTPRSQDA